MAEAWLSHLYSDRFETESAGLDAGQLNPLAVQVMKEVGIDISQKQTKGVFDLFKTGRMYSYVITVCDEASAERYPIFPGVTNRLHWSFSDPAAATGTEDQKLDQVRRVRDAIRKTIITWAEEIQSVST